MARVRLSGHDVVIIDALDDACTFSDLREATNVAAETLQGLIADGFEEETTYRGALKKNTEAYEASKESQGFDDRRGHREGNLQLALHEVKLWSANVTKKRIVIKFHESRLFSEVPHAEFYAENKARGGHIVGIARDWLSEVEAVFDVCEARAHKKRRRAG